MVTESASLYGRLFTDCPDDWKIIPFSEAVDFREGPGILAKDFRDRGVPLLRLKNIERPFVDLAGCNYLDPEMVSTRWDHFRVREGDLLVSTSGTLGRVSVGTPAANGAIPYTGIIRMRPARDDVAAGFIRYFLTSPQFQVQAEALAAGSVLRHFGPSHLREMSFPLPPLDEQHGIAGILGSLDEKLEQNRRTARSLEQLARAIFRAWFVDFEPVKAKAVGATSFPSVPQAVFDGLPTRLVDSNHGPVPEGWEVGVVKDLAALSKAQVQPQESPQEVFDHFSIPSFDTGERPTVEAGAGIKSNKFLVVDGSVLLSKLNPRIPRAWLPPMPSGRKQIASTEFLVFVPRQPSDRHYLYCQFQESAFRDALAQGATGTSNSHQRVRPEDVLHRPIVMPPALARKGFADTIDPLFELAKANRDESAKLAEMRDYLLPKLLTGQVRVGGTDA